MEFTPKHVQPFTLHEATHLDIPVITTEIARLELSLKHLHSTQDQLAEHLDDPANDDKDLRDAHDENKAVIASQQERILMLRLAIQLKGGPAASNPHYSSSQQTSPQPATSAAHEAPRVPSTQSSASQTDTDGGIFL